MKYAFGVDVGGTTVKLGFFEETGRLLTRWEIPTRPENGGSGPPGRQGWTRSPASW